MDRHGNEEKDGGKEGIPDIARINEEAEGLLVGVGGIIKRIGAPEYSPFLESK